VLTLLQPALFLALLLAPIEPAARLAADSARPLLRALDVVASVAARLPGGVARASPSLLGAVAAGVACVALLGAASTRRRRGACVVAGTAALAAASWAHLAPAAGAGTFAELHAIDVGQGDAVALRTPRGRWVLFDAGRGGRGMDAGARIVVPYLRRRGALAAVVLSHRTRITSAGAAVRDPRLRQRRCGTPGSRSGARRTASAHRRARRRRALAPRPVGDHWPSTA
jgi:competence protein ComEC